MRLADGCGHDPLARRRGRRTRSHAGHDVVVRPGIRQVDQRIREDAEVEHVRMGIDEPGQDRRTADVDPLGARAGDALHVVQLADADDAAVALDERFRRSDRSVAGADEAADVECRRHAERVVTRRAAPRQTRTQSFPSSDGAARKYEVSNGGTPR